MRINRLLDSLRIPEASNDEEIMERQSKNTDFKKKNASQEQLPRGILSKQELRRYFVTFSPLYDPHSLQTRWLSFNSPHSAHFTIPGTASFKCVRRFLLAVLDVLLNGTANIPTSLKKSIHLLRCHDLSKNFAKSAIRGSIRSF